MKKFIFFIFCLLYATLTLQAQTEEENGFQNENGLYQENELQQEEEGKFTNRTGQKEKPPITDYKIIDIKNDTTYVDTTLSIQKDYQFNYLRRDNFGLQPLNNVGHTYTSLIKRESINNILPEFGARAKHFNYLEVEDIMYYNVPTPLTELYFKTTFEQGQQLDALFTINTSPQLNFMIAYKGVTSLGKYQNNRVTTGNFRTSANFHTKNHRYHLKTHFTSQDLTSEENGGLSPSGLNQYLNNTEEFEDEEDSEDRRGIEVAFEDASSTLDGKRFYLDHTYRIIQKNDSTPDGIEVGHRLHLNDKKFRFLQATSNDLFGLSYVSNQLGSQVALEDFTNEVFLLGKHSSLGVLSVSAITTNYNYGYNRILRQSDSIGNITTITNRIKGDIVAIGGNYAFTKFSLNINASGKTIISGDFTGNAFQVQGFYNYQGFELGGEVNINSVAPNYNFLLFQQDYITYNWQNINTESQNFENIQTNKISATLKARNWANIEASITDISNFTYFTKNEDSITVPRQFTNNVNLLKVRFNQDIRFKWFGLNNTVMYQKVSEGNEVYRVPELITRNTLYYQDEWFKKALFLQTGVTFKYYSSYDADGYDPVLGEFYTQSPNEIAYFDGEGTEQEFGGFPQVDLFFNAKIRQTRIFFTVENFGEAFDQNNEFSAPGYPPRDAVIRFGIVWNFFL
ncbi:putative porin [Aquimarina sp. ERC-38]|uniref:putative porin n=1 Tax=Aquimarina sp. ERC-38 TaxID=2949996 RepID=UPI00224647C6|nr:putative porin [Aquimarina sp. ERC-38]UZO81032.1 putative porin [Aquimarina sp. ERC-38]